MGGHQASNCSGRLHEHGLESWDCTASRCGLFCKQLEAPDRRSNLPTAPGNDPLVVRKKLVPCSYWHIMKVFKDQTLVLMKRRCEKSVVYQSKCCSRWLPDSARWLMSNGKIQRAHYYLSQCAKINNKEQFMADLKPEVQIYNVFITNQRSISQHFGQTLTLPSSQSLTKVIVVENENRKYSYLDLVRTPRMRRLALLTGIVWYSISVSPSSS